MDNIFKILMGPLLYWQGQQVRKHTPRLAEAKGPRQGVYGKGKRLLRLLIIGDSAAAGVGVDDQKNGLAGQMLKGFDPQFRISWQLVAKSGITTEKMIDMLESLKENSFDLAVTSLGVNDVKAGVDPEGWLLNQKKLISLMEEKFKVKQTVISAVPPMEKFPALPWPLNQYLGRRGAKMNQLLSSWICVRKNLHYLPFDMDLDPGLMAKDGFHPGPALHTLWAEQILGVLAPFLTR